MQVVFTELCQHNVFETTFLTQRRPTIKPGDHVASSGVIEGKAGDRNEVGSGRRPGRTSGSRGSQSSRDIRLFDMLLRQEIISRTPLIGERREDIVTGASRHNDLFYASVFSCSCTVLVLLGSLAVTQIVLALALCSYASS